MRYMFVLIFLLFFISNLCAGIRPEAIVSESANVFIKTSPVKRVLNSLYYAINNIVDNDTKVLIDVYHNNFLRKTGVDYLEEHSLRTLGVDVNKSICFVQYPEVNTSQMMIMIPVYDGKIFPLKFIQLLKKNNPLYTEIYPVITPYRQHSIYQIKRDVFVTSVDNYFLIASNGDVIRDAINNGLDKKSTLLYNKNYQSYLNTRNVDHDINIFLSKKIMVNKFQNSSIKMSNPVAKSNSNYDLDQIYNHLEYECLGISFVNKSVIINSALSFDGESKDNNHLLGVLKTKFSGKSIYVDNASLLYLAFDFNYLKRSCKKGFPLCSQYDLFKKRFLSSTGVSFDKEILPYYDGTVNVFGSLDGAKNNNMNYALFLPMNNRTKIRNIWTKIRISVIKRNKGKSKNGIIYLNKNKVFWFIRSGIKNYIAYSSNGIYMGNNAVLMKKALVARTLHESVGVMKIPPNVFLFGHLKKNFLRDALLLDNKEIPSWQKKLIENIVDINIISKKIDNTLSLDCEIKIK